MYVNLYILSILKFTILPFVSWLNLPVFVMCMMCETHNFDLKTYDAVSVAFRAKTKALHHTVMQWI